MLGNIESTGSNECVLNVLKCSFMACISEKRKIVSILDMAVYKWDCRMVDLPGVPIARVLERREAKKQISYFKCLYKLRSFIVCEDNSLIETIGDTL